MTNEKTIRLALIACLGLSLFLYHGLEVVLGSVREPSYFELGKLAQIAVTAVVFVLLLNWPPVVRLFLRDKFIAGKYVGTANHHAPKPGDESPTNVECTIDQTLFGATVSGRSFNDQGLVSTWIGNLYHLDGKEFSFAVDLRWKDPEVGILKLMVDDGSAHGIYYSADPGYPYPFTISATREKCSSSKNRRWLRFWR